MKTTTYNPDVLPKRHKTQHQRPDDIITTDRLLTGANMGFTDEEICASIQKAKNYKDPEAKWSNPHK